METYLRERSLIIRELMKRKTLTGLSALPGMRVLIERAPAAEINTIMRSWS